MAKNEIIDTADQSDWEARMAEAAREDKQALAEYSGDNRIILTSGQLSYMDAQLPGNQLDAVIIASYAYRAYYRDKYNPDDPQPPSCMSYGPAIAVSPDPEVENPVSSKCTTCPMNAFGTDPMGRGGKACKETRVLALVPLDALDVANPTIATFKLPTMSVVGKYPASYKAYTAALPRGVWSQVTNIKATPHPKWQVMVSFTESRATMKKEQIIKAFSLRERAAQVLADALKMQTKEGVAPQERGDL